MEYILLTDVIHVEVVTNHIQDTALVKGPSCGGRHGPFDSNLIVLVGTNAAEVSHRKNERVKRTAYSVVYP